MRKLILISAFVLASVSAQAGESRSLILAANDAPAATAETAKPAEAQTEAAKSEAGKSEATTADVKADIAKPEAAQKHASRSKRVHARHYEGDEAKARRIAARYGVYW
ncbi:MAG TPA: hypothetical protein VE267_12030 [Bradyrhizobium sp.]|nr:hypothetical protein [Bradyrhizobium sp.]